MYENDNIRYYPLMYKYQYTHINIYTYIIFCKETALKRCFNCCLDIFTVLNLTCYNFTY